MNKKIIGLLLSAAIFTGVGSYGTYAYFTDQAKVSEDIVIEMGSVKVNAKWGENPWKVDSNNKKIKALDNGESLKYTNVKKGDTFSRKVFINSTGTLESNIKVKLNNPNSEFFDIYIKEGSIKVKDGLKDVKKTSFYVDNFNTNEELSFIIEVKIKKQANNKEEKIDFKGNVENFIVVDAEQLK